MSYIIQLEPSKHDLLQDALIDQGFVLTPGDHLKFRARKEGISCTLYNSGKLLVQGKQSADWIDFFLEPEITQRIERSSNSRWHEGFQPHLGSDEAGKGDLFGPLCVACVFVESEQLDALHRLGVQDSKRIADSKIREMALGIWRLCPCEVKILPPALYNKLWAKFKNLNRLMAWVHSQLIIEMAKRCSTHPIGYALVDQFSTHSGIARQVSAAGLSLIVDERVRAESDPAVAAASILARASFIKGLHRCSEQVGVELPKGSGETAKSALAKLLHSRPELELSSCVKLHFKTVSEVLAAQRPPLS